MSTLSPSGVSTRAPKRPRTTRCSESAGSSRWKTTSPLPKVRRRAIASSRDVLGREIGEQRPLHAGSLCNDGDIRNVVSRERHARAALLLSGHEDDEEGAHMKRIATIGAIVTAFAVAPAVAAAGNVVAQIEAAEPQGAGRRRPGREGAARAGRDLACSGIWCRSRRRSASRSAPPAASASSPSIRVGESRGSRKAPLSRFRGRRCRPGEPGRVSRSRPVASRSAATIAAVETTVGGSPTPFRPYGASGSGSSTSSETTGGMSRNVGMR